MNRTLRYSERNCTSSSREAICGANGDELQIGEALYAGTLYHRGTIPLSRRHENSLQGLGLGSFALSEVSPAQFQCCTFGFACCSQFEGLQVVATFAIFSSFILFTITQSPRHIVMKSISMLALAGTAAAATYPDLKIPHLSTHQPSGEKFDYYHIDFNVTSENGGSPSTSWCSA
jgi:hypothetical protein